jgi:peptide/nickel transport system substrate-binding protein
VVEHYAGFRSRSTGRYSGVLGPSVSSLVLTVCTAVGMVLGVAACDPNPAAGRDPGRLTVARTGDIDLLDPAKATAFQTVQTLDLVYDRLLTTDGNGDLAPGLAERWEVRDDAVELTLRQGVRFHDGTPFTAEDAKATLERNLAEETGSAVGSYLANITSIEADGPARLTLELDRPDASLLTALTYTGNSILAKKDIDAGTIGKKVNGTGAYAWRRWDQGRRLELTANAAYWAGAPRIPALEFRVIPDEASVLAGMKAGGFDLGLVSDPVVARQTRGAAGVEVHAQPTLSYHALMLNARRGPLGDVRVRQAIACAIDRQQVVDAVYAGEATVTGPITSPAYRYDPTAGLSCPGAADPARARQLLADAGHPDGFELKTIVMLGEYSTSTNVAQSVQAQLAAVGVRLELDRQQTGVYVENWKKGDFDAAVALNGGSTDPYLIYNRYFTDGGSLATAAGYGSDRLDSLLAEANATADPRERARVFGTLQRQLLAESPWVWLLRNQMYYIVGKGVTGFQPLPTESLESLRRTARAG